MTYQTEIDFHPLYELVSSMSVFLSSKPHYDLDKQWFETLKGKVSPSLKDKIQDEEKLHELGFLMILMWKCPNKSSLTEFLKWLHAFSVGEIYEILIPYFGDYPLKDLGAFREFYSNLLISWDDVYSIEEETIELLEERTRVLKEESKSMNPVDFVENCTNGIRIYPMEDIKNVLLVPSIHTAPLNRIYELNNTMFVHFAVDQPSKDSTIPSLSFIRKTKALADPKRLRILQFLSSEPKTFTEIGKEIKLSKSNLHYHLTLLRTAGLVRINNYKFKEPDKYETRPLGFTALQNEIESYIFK
jgi:DNA-binding transcriptional ArsR family regulator